MYKQGIQVCGTNLYEMQNVDFVTSIGNSIIPIFYYVANVVDIFKEIEDPINLKINETTFLAKVLDNGIMVSKKQVKFVNNNELVFISFENIKTVHYQKIKLWTIQYALTVKWIMSSLERNKKRAADIRSGKEKRDEEESIKEYRYLAELSEKKKQIEKELAKREKLIKHDVDLSKYKDYISSEEEAVAYDSDCGEPIKWGYKIINRMPEDLFNSLYNIKWGKLECIEWGHWAIVTKNLEYEEAVEKYGKVTNEEFGPRGGFRSITFGTTCFVNRQLIKKD